MYQAIFLDQLASYPIKVQTFSSLRLKLLIGCHNKFVIDVTTHSFKLTDIIVHYGV